MCLKQRRQHSASQKAELESTSCGSSCFAPAAVACAAGCFRLRWEFGLDLAARGPVARLCWDSLHFGWDEFGGGFYKGHGEALRSYLLLCEESFHELGSEQRAVLGPLLGAALPEAVRRRLSPEPERRRTRPACESLGCRRWFRQRLGATHRQRPRLPFLLSPRRSPVSDRGRVRGLAAGAGRGSHRHERLGRMLGPWLARRSVMTAARLRRLLRACGVQQLPDWARNFSPIQVSVAEYVRPSEVGDALRLGEIVRFDAHEVLPPEVFGLSLTSLARAKGWDGLALPAHGYDAAFHCREAFWHESGGLAWASRVLPRLDALVCPEVYRLEQLLHGQYLPPTAKVNALRVPALANVSEAVVREALGLSSSVEHMVSQLWLGYARVYLHKTLGGRRPHYDEQDNIIFSIAGVSLIALAPPQYTLAVRGVKVREKLSSRLPYYCVLLKPGEAVVVPSGSYHAVLASDDRVTLNTFLEPTFGSGEASGGGPGQGPSGAERRPGTLAGGGDTRHQEVGLDPDDSVGTPPGVDPNDSVGTPPGLDPSDSVGTPPGIIWRRESVERRALRDLWIRSVRKLWERHKLGLFWQGSMEIL